MTKSTSVAGSVPNTTIGMYNNPWSSMLPKIDQAMPYNNMVMGMYTPNVNTTPVGPRLGITDNGPNLNDLYKQQLDQANTASGWNIGLGAVDTLWNIGSGLENFNNTALARQDANSKWADQLAIMQQDKKLAEDRLALDYAKSGRAY